MVRGMNTSSAMSAFERMEEKVLMQEARAQAQGELAGADLESQFARLEGSSDVDDELAALKSQMLPLHKVNPNCHRNKKLLLLNLMRWLMPSWIPYASNWINCKIDRKLI